MFLVTLSQEGDCSSYSVFPLPMGDILTEVASTGSFKFQPIFLFLCSVLPGDDWFMDVAQEVVSMISGKGRAANGDREVNSPTASISAHSISSFKSHGSS